MADLGSALTSPWFTNAFTAPFFSKFHVLAEHLDGGIFHDSQYAPDTLLGRPSGGAALCKSHLRADDVDLITPSGMVDAVACLPAERRASRVYVSGGHRALERLSRR